MTSAPILLRRSASALRVGPRGWALIVEAAAALFAARTRLRFLPFRRVAWRLGAFVAPAAIEARPVVALLSHDDRVAREVGWAVRTIAPLMPCRAVCIEQAIAAQAMLRRRGVASILRLGVEGAGGVGFSAHAWLIAGDRRVTGYPVAPSLTAVGCFVCDGDGGARVEDDAVVEMEGAAWD